MYLTWTVSPMRPMPLSVSKVSGLVRLPSLSWIFQLTVPVLLPLLEPLSISPIWFGVFVVILMTIVSLLDLGFGKAMFAIFG